VGAGAARTKETRARRRMVWSNEGIVKIKPHQVAVQSVENGNPKTLRLKKTTAEGIRGNAKERCPAQVYWKKMEARPKQLEDRMQYKQAKNNRKKCSLKKTGDTMKSKRHAAWKDR
jgi:hypothetical protein